MNMIREIAPECLLPLDPTFEWAARMMLEKAASEAPGCPAGVAASDWRRFEGLFGLGPLFPGSLSRLSEDELRYGMYRIGDTAKIGFLAHDIVSSLLSLWTANIMLRSKSLRLNNGSDLAIDYILPNLLKTAAEREDPEMIMAVALQYGYGLLSSPVQVNNEMAAKVLSQCRDWFSEYNAVPLYSLAAALHSRASGQTLPADAEQTIETLGYDPQDADLHHLYHGVLDACFPGPRLEATDAYHSAMLSFREKLIQAATDLKAGFAKQGQERWNADFWEVDSK
jgi:hypothetical protein